MQSHLKNLKLPAKPSNPNMRAMLPEDVPAVHRLLNDYLDKKYACKVIKHILYTFFVQHQPCLQMYSRSFTSFFSARLVHGSTPLQYMQCFAFTMCVCACLIVCCVYFMPRLVPGTPPTSPNKLIDLGCVERATWAGIFPTFHFIFISFLHLSSFILLKVVRDLVLNLFYS